MQKANLMPILLLGEQPVFIDHIKKACDLVESHDDALVVLSGGQTREEAGPRSEGGSYYECGQLLGCINDANKRRITTEEHARDSLENVAFSLARFEQMAGAAPLSVIVCMPWSYACNYISVFAGCRLGI